MGSYKCIMVLHCISISQKKICCPSELLWIGHKRWTSCKLPQLPQVSLAKKKFSSKIPGDEKIKGAKLRPPWHRWGDGHDFMAFFPQVLGHGNSWLRTPKKASPNFLVLAMVPWPWERSWSSLRLDLLASWCRFEGRNEAKSVGVPGSIHSWKKG